MRRITTAMGSLASAASLAAVSFGVLSDIAAPPRHLGRTRYPKGKRPLRSKFLPHQGEREIARRLRNAQRDKTNRAARLIQFCTEVESKALYVAPDAIGISRRGKPIRAAK